MQVQANEYFPAFPFGEEESNMVPRQAAWLRDISAVPTVLKNLWLLHVGTLENINPQNLCYCGF